jgi:hypothetical protein
MSGGGHDDGGLGHRIASGQAGGAKSPGQHPMDINSAFGRNAEAMKALLHGNDVELAKAGLTIAQMTGGDATSGGGGGEGSSAGQGHGGGVAAVSSDPSGGHQSKFTEDYYVTKAERHGGHER